MKTTTNAKTYDNKKVDFVYCRADTGFLFEHLLV